VRSYPQTLRKTSGKTATINRHSKRKSREKIFTFWDIGSKRGRTADRYGRCTGLQTESHESEVSVRNRMKLGKNKTPKRNHQKGWFGRKALVLAIAISRIVNRSQQMIKKKEGDWRSREKNLPRGRKPQDQMPENSFIGRSKTITFFRVGGKIPSGRQRKRVTRGRLRIWERGGPPNIITARGGEFCTDDVKRERGQVCSDVVKRAIKMERLETALGSESSRRVRERNRI